MNKKLLGLLMISPFVSLILYSLYFAITKATINDFYLLLWLSWPIWLLLLGFITVRGLQILLNE